MWTAHANVCVDQVRPVTPLKAHQHVINIILMTYRQRGAVKCIEPHLDRILQASLSAAEVAACTFARLATEVLLRLGSWFRCKPLRGLDLFLEGWLGLSTLSRTAGLADCCISGRGWGAGALMAYFSGSATIFLRSAL